MRVDDHKKTSSGEEDLRYSYRLKRGNYSEGKGHNTHQCNSYLLDSPSGPSASKLNEVEVFADCVNGDVLVTGGCGSRWTCFVFLF